jgi:hypothetical protein
MTKALNTWAPIVIALCALVLTVWESMERREYNRLLLEPRLTLEYSFHGSSNNLGGMFLKNDGLGPAIVRHMSLIYNDEYYSLLGEDEADRAYHALFSDELVENLYSYIMQEGSVIQPGESIPVFTIRDNPNNDSFINEINNSGGAIYIFGYESLMGDSKTFTYNLDKVMLFDRNTGEPMGRYIDQLQ